MTTILTDLVNAFQAATAGWFAALFPIARNLFFTLAAIEIAWAASLVGGRARRPDADLRPAPEADPRDRVLPGRAHLRRRLGPGLIDGFATRRPHRGRAPGAQPEHRDRPGHRRRVDADRRASASRAGSPRPAATSWPRSPRCSPSSPSCHRRPARARPDRDVHRDRRRRPAPRLRRLALDDALRRAVPRATPSPIGIKLFVLYLIIGVGTALAASWAPTLAGVGTSPADLFAILGASARLHDRGLADPVLRLVADRGVGEPDARERALHRRSMAGDSRSA